MKRIISLLLIFAMLTGMLPMTTWATEMDVIGGTCGENLTWTFDESSGSLKISGTGDMDDYSWSQMYDPTGESSDIWVTNAPWRDYYSAIKSIVIESDVTRIGDGAFRGCSAATSISLSNDVEVLGEYSFVDCDGIIDIVIPENVKTIGEAAFGDCNALEKASILGATSIGNFAFSECASLESVVLPGTLTSIGEYAFRGCEALKKITIPSSVRTIGTFAFVWCENLNEICFEGSAPSMDGTVLSGLACNVSYPSDDKTWSEELQKEFDATITWNGNSSDGGGSGSSHSHSYGDWYETKAPTQEAEGEERRNCTGCDHYEIRATDKLSVTEEPDNTCGENLTWTLVEGVLTVNGTGVMDQYSENNPAPWYKLRNEITTVVINYGVENISESAFAECINITNVNIADTVNSVGAYAFENCASLISIDIPDAEQYIGMGTFMGCTSLESVSLPDNLLGIGYEAFRECKSLKSVSIPASVIRIEDGAFYHCTSLETIDLPSAELTMEGSVFNGCASLRAISIPEGTTTIGNAMFADCVSLESVELPNSVTVIHIAAFSGCASLKSIVLPDKVTMIRNAAFSDCSKLNSVTIPVSVNSIELAAFNSCSALKDVYYAGTEDQWKEITIDEMNDGLTNATIHYQSAGGSSPDPHKHSYTAVTTAPTCTEQGYTTYTCSCNDRYVSDYVEETGHSYGEWYEYTAPTNAAIGEERRDCENCTDYESRSIPSLSPTLIDSGECGRDLQWRLTSDGVLSITGTGPMTNWEYNYNSPYGNLAPWNQYRLDIWTIDIGSGVTSIGSYAFNSCINVTDIRIPASLEAIGKDAFGGGGLRRNLYINDLAAWCKVDFKSRGSAPLQTYGGNLYINGEKPKNLLSLMESRK